MTQAADELASRVAHHMLDAEGTGPAWGVKLEEVREDYARVAMVVRADMLNGHGFAHGGMIFALADSAFAYVCNGANHASMAAQASIVFLDKVREGETLIAEATEVAREGRAGVEPWVGGGGGGGFFVEIFPALARPGGGSVVVFKHARAGAPLPPL